MFCTLGFDSLRREGNKITTTLLKPNYFRVTCLKKTSRERYYLWSQSHGVASIKYVH